MEARFLALTNMFCVAAFGAISLDIREWYSPPLNRVMTKPPPMPMLMLCTAPLQKSVATAASTAVPFRRKTSLKQKET
jgi:hypothetical protein